MLFSFYAHQRIVRFKPRFNQMFKPEFKPKLKMKATISVICYKSKTLVNGEHPLMLRITQNRESSYKSLNVSILAKHWDFEKEEPKPTCPNKELINKIILKTHLEFQEKLLEKVGHRHVT